MAEVCSRVCAADHHCEHTCILDSVSEPVAISGIERFLAEYAFRHGQVSTATASPNGFKVAVVGSGPGGLACAETLARRGCTVTVFDESLVPGGLLVNGLSALRIENSVIQRRLELIQKLGVTFQMGVQLGKDLELSRLRQDYAAVFLASDSRASRPLDISGAQLNGVVQALPFLLQKRTSVELDVPDIEVSGKRVVVIGAGDTALDCLRVALRWGARESVGVYRRGEVDMTCSRPDYLSAVEEGVRFVFNAVPLSVLDDGVGKVKALRCVRTESTESDSRGRHGFRELPDEVFDMEVDVVVAALGFDPKPFLHSGDFSELAVNSWGGLRVDSDQMTNLPGVFAGGDIVHGPSLVLETVRDGRHAAEGILRYLAAMPAKT
jgi:glutamate synthase (NADPH/NADH) small chain